jgi:hypothetical protein
MVFLLKMIGRVVFVILIILASHYISFGDKTLSQHAESIMSSDVAKKTIKQAEVFFVDAYSKAVSWVKKKQ